MSRVPIIVDYREQKPYKFPGEESRTEKLNVGDYTLEGFRDKFAVERKTLNDLATSVGTDRLRFENEIRRANGYANRNEDDNPIPGTAPNSALDEFVVVIEADKRDLYKYAGRSSCPNYYSNIHPNSLIGTLESWPDKYQNLDFIFAGSRNGGCQETLRKLDQWYLKHS